MFQEKLRNLALLAALTGCVAPRNYDSPAPPSGETHAGQTLNPEDNSSAGGIELSFGASSQVVSEYRQARTGRKLDDAGVQSEVSVSAEVADGTTVRGGVWNHAPINDNPKSFEEVDFTLGLNQDLGHGLSANIGFNTYTFPDRSDHIPTIEQVVGSVTQQDLFGTGVNISFDSGRAISGRHFTDARLQVSYPISVSEDLSIAPTVKVGGVLDRGDFFSREGIASYRAGLTVDFRNPFLSNSHLKAGFDLVDGHMKEVPDGGVFWIGLDFRF